MVTRIRINIALGDGLLSDDTKVLPEPTGAQPITLQRRLSLAGRFHKTIPDQYWLITDEPYWSFAEDNCTGTFLDITH